MKLPWGRKLPTGAALEAEAERFGVTLHDIYKTKDGLKYLDEPELQRRVLAARTALHNARIARVQTFGIIGTLLLTLVLALWSGHREAKRESGDMMIKFGDLLSSGQSGILVKALDRYGNLDKINMSGEALDDAIEDLLDKYEDLATAYRNDLIDDDMAYDAFSYDLEMALKDSKVRRFLLQSRREEPDFYRRRAGTSAILSNRHQPDNNFVHRQSLADAAWTSSESVVFSRDSEGFRIWKPSFFPC